MTASLVDSAPAVLADQHTGLAPLMLDLRGRACLVVGGGTVAARRVQALVDAGARVSVVAPDLGEGLRRLVDAGHLSEWRPRPYEAGDVRGHLLVVAATDDPEVNRRIGADARAGGALVNRIDDAASGDVVVPAVVRRGDLVIAVSTGGANPTLAAHVRREIERSFGPEWGALTALLGEFRPRLATAAGTPDGRRRAVCAIIDAGVLDHLARGDTDGARMLVRRILEEERL